MFTKIKKDQSGFTLIDTVSGIVIMCFVLPVILMITSDMNSKSLNDEVYDKATSFGNTIMNYIIGHRFDENYNTTGAPWTYPLGQNSGDYDDIDDFISADWSIIPGYANMGYQATSNIFYIDPSVDLMSSCNYQTNFKRIVVIINHANLSNPLTLTSIMTPHGT